MWMGCVAAILATLLFVSLNKLVCIKNSQFLPDYNNLWPWNGKDTHKCLFYRKKTNISWIHLIPFVRRILCAFFHFCLLFVMGTPGWFDMDCPNRRSTWSPIKWELVFFPTEVPLKLRSVFYCYITVVNTNRALRPPNGQWYTRRKHSEDHQDQAPDLGWRGLLSCCTLPLERPPHPHPSGSHPIIITLKTHLFKLAFTC